jgi:hypothetical protein
LTVTHHRIIVSIPVDLTGDTELAKLEEKGVRGRYVSVERLQEVEGGKVLWQMATSSTPGGNIPRFVAEGSMAGQISAVRVPPKLLPLDVLISNLRLESRMSLTSSSGSILSAPRPLPSLRTSLNKIRSWPLLLETSVVLMIIANLCMLLKLKEYRR